MINAYTASDVNMFSKAFAGAGTNIRRQAANENTIEVVPVKSLNSSLVKMIDQLTQLDGYLKQKLQNQKIVDRNARLAEHEADIENTDVQRLQTTTPDAEPVSNSSSMSGLLGLGALGLLAFEPVREAIGGLINLAADSGKFATKVLKSVNGLFQTLLSGTPDTTTPQAETSMKPVQAEPSSAVPVPNQENEVPPSAVPQEQSGFIPTVVGSALIGGAVGALVPFVKARTGATVGAGYAAYNYFSSPSESTTSSSTATGGSTSPVTSTPAPTTSTTKQESSKEKSVTGGEIPKNDIVALGNYLVGKGAEKSKMEHMALSGRVGEHSKNSRHYRGMAIDVNFPGPNEASILDALEPQLRAAGYSTIWRKPGHTTHMHVSVGSREGSSGDYASDAAMTSTIGQMAAEGLEETAKLIGSIGAKLVGPGTLRGINTPLPDVSAIIKDSTIKENTTLMQSKTPATPPKISPPNINTSTKSQAVENPPTMSDRNRITYYLDRFNYNDLSTPTKALAKSNWA